MNKILLQSSCAFALFAALPAQADDAAQIQRGKQLFTTSTPACAVCHSLKDAGAEGAIGPVLDELKPDAQRVARAVREGIGSMPSFKDSLSEADISAIALYVSKASSLR